ncbi:MAG: hypothetical protein ABIE46_03150 [Patescibacteria group bacterium]
MKILTMCQGGNSRSVAMAFLLKYKYNIDAIACSWEKNSSETLRMLFEWADNILIMESDFEKYIPTEYKHKIIITDVGYDQWFSIRKDLIELCDILLESYKIKGN